jgi:hypothetical protein
MLPSKKKAQKSSTNSESNAQQQPLVLNKIAQQVP